MFGVFLAQKCFFRRYVPIYSKGLVNNRNTTIYFRMIEFITLILKHSCFTQYSKTMSKATRHKELAMIIFRQFHSHMLTISGTAFTNIHRNIKHGSFDTSNKFALRKR